MISPSDFFATKVKRAKGFGFPEPIFLNAETLTDNNRVIYIVEIQAAHVPNPGAGSTQHFYLKFSKFKKINQEPYWAEEDLVGRKEGFSINEKGSIEKLAGYIKANQALLNIDILSKDYTSAILSNDEVSLDIIKQILSSEKNREAVFQLFKEQYPELDKKILAYKLVQARKKSLEEFQHSLNDAEKIERNYWQPFLEKNRWMFGLSYFVLLDDSKIDLWDTADYLFESDDGFIDIVEIKHPHINFWQKDRQNQYKKYRGNLVPDEELKGSISQASNYIFQVEKRFNDPDWCRKNNVETPVKPTCTIIFGRSNDWGIEEKTAFRLLNDSLHGINILTFDHFFSRADRLLNVMEEKEA